MGGAKDIGDDQAVRNTIERRGTEDGGFNTDLAGLTELLGKFAHGDGWWGPAIHQ